MNWYYAQGSEQKGPVPQAELDRLAHQGVITASTLVWREGMEAWKPYASTLGQAAPPAPALPPASTPIAPRIHCAACHQPLPSEELIFIGNQFICARCKPLALQRLQEGVVERDADAEDTRKDHLQHEASVKALGALFLLAGLLIILSGSGMLMAVIGSRASGSSAAGACGLVFLGALNLWIALGLRKLKSSARWTAVILSVIGMILAFPLGTIINAYFLYLLLSEKGRMVFSAEYQEVIEATPHLKYRTPMAAWIALGLLVFLLAIGIIVAIRS